MKRIGGYTLGAVAALSLLLFAWNPSGDQKPASIQKRIYIVQQGDTLWSLARAKFGDSLQWEQIVADNPFLEEEGRLYFKNGRAHVRIYPGETLLGF